MYFSFNNTYVIFFHLIVGPLYFYLWFKPLNLLVGTGNNYMEECGIAYAHNLYSEKGDI